MNEVAQTNGIEAKLYESLALKGDISGLSPKDKVAYYGELCKRSGLDPYTQPFSPLRLNGKEVLYANKGCTDQLARIHQLTREVKSREKVDDCYVVTVRATGKDGRFDDAIGALSVKGLAGEALANAWMKAETKAKRRATLSYCGMGMLDEIEVESIQAMEPRAIKETTMEKAKATMADASARETRREELAVPHPVESSRIDEVNRARVAAGENPIQDDEGRAVALTLYNELMALNKSEAQELKRLHNRNYPKLAEALRLALRFEYEKGDPVDGPAG